MIEISISCELAAEHPDFMAGCAERGHRVDVFGPREKGISSDGRPAAGGDVASDGWPLSAVWRQRVGRR